MASGTTRLRVHSARQSQALPLSFTRHSSFLLLSAALHQGTYKCTPWALTWYQVLHTYSETVIATTYLQSMQTLLTPPIPSQAARDYYCVVHRFPIKGYHAKTCRSQSMVSATTTRALVVVEKPGRDRATHGDHLDHPVGCQGQTLLCETESCFGEQALR